eukprot:CAMPEP_0175616702 /NCGR_PEP_ID=MMETSP0096-20121207/66019_1 /TAXON_ID=311494 /ORGANISM="Alexandrium monilatum, Strain CCMP3105" /LENGTH=104 /DNA_ID=CAMNT_0016921875 /DNA_START=170 /DNA_END=485 /DNA_ORIENTATION=+
MPQHEVVHLAGRCVQDARGKELLHHVLVQLQRPPVDVLRHRVAAHTEVMELCNEVALVEHRDLLKHLARSLADSTSQETATPVPSRSSHTGDLDESAATSSPET